MKLLNIAQVIIALLLMTVILMQNRGSGLSGIFGGSGNIYRTKRGLEKNLFVATIILAVLFFVISLVNIILF
jgi:preprotein translocase subunit SecG